MVSRASNRSWQKHRNGSISLSVYSARRGKSGGLAAKDNFTETGDGREPTLAKYLYPYNLARHHRGRSADPVLLVVGVNVPKWLEQASAAKVSMHT
jgi:hypothetical protein